MVSVRAVATTVSEVSVLFNEPKLLKSSDARRAGARTAVSVLFNEPKLLKWRRGASGCDNAASFSALQRAEIAEMFRAQRCEMLRHGFSALQRAEIAEIARGADRAGRGDSFSALQRAEIAEICRKLPVRR